MTIQASCEDRSFRGRFRSGSGMVMRRLAAAISILLCAAGAQAGALFRLQPVGRDVWAAIALPHSSAGSNAGFVIGSTGVLVVDTFEDPAAARELLAEIHRRTALPIRYVINTHYHLDHVAGNGVFRDAGAVILAQRNVRAWERTENLKFFGRGITPQQQRMVESYVRPSVLYRDGVELFLGDRRVVVRVLPGHTGGDSVVVVPDAGVVFTGDLFWCHSLPNLIDADTRAQIASDATMQSEYPSAVFVPGHGDVGHAGDVRAFAAYLSSLRDAVKAARARGESGSVLTRAVEPGLRTVYGRWNYFDHFVGPNIAQTTAEIAGTKHVPVPLPGP